MAVQLTEPLIMFGVYVESFTSAVGYGAESSTMQMTLVEDPDNGITVKHSLDSGATLIDGFPEVGTVCQFAFEGFEFVGIFQRHNYSQSGGGRKYDVTFESPSKILDGVQVILTGFEGTGFWDNPFFPAEGWNFTSQLHNVYNPFGVKENYSWGGTFGFSDYNEAGFPVPDDANLQGLAAKGLLTMIEEISQSKYTYDNPNGPAANTSFNSNNEELIGGPIHYGDSEFVIDFGNLKTIVPNFFRMKGPTKSINSILQECCELIVHDYVTIINPIYTQQLTGYGTGTVPRPQYQSVIRNGVAPTQHDSNGNVTGPVISFKYLNKTKQPVPGVVADLVEAAKRNGTLVSANNGKEYADVVTQKMIIGDAATRVWEAGMEYLIPVYGKDLNGNWLLGSGFSDTDTAPVLLGTGAIHYAYIQELRAALSGYDTWQLYHALGELYGYSQIASPIFGGLAMGAANQFARRKAMLQNKSPGGAIQAGFNGDASRMVLLAGVAGTFGSDDEGLTSYNAVLHTATQFYGKTYFVLLPVEPGGLDNNIRYKNNFETEAAWEISDSGWDPDFRVKDIDMYDNDGGLKACAGFYPSSAYGVRDFSGIEKTSRYTSPASRDLVGTEITVDKQIYWRNNPYYQNNNNPYDNVSAMVHITCPQVLEQDALSTQKAALDSFFNSNMGQAQGMGGQFNGFGDRLFNQNTQGQTPNNYVTFENELTHLKFAKKAVRPFKVSIPQKSTRYSWGPWYKFSTKKGKAEVERNATLKPQTFGSMNLLDKAGIALADAGTADLYASESGSVELAEFPQYNIADRFNTNGPYITKMDISVGTGGLITKYQFSTWTRNFGKIAKYNIDRIAKANKDHIKAMKEGTASIPGVSRLSLSSNSPADRAVAINPQDMNFFSGLQVPMDQNNSRGRGPSNWSMSMRTGGALQFDLPRDVDFHGVVGPAYDFSFGSTPEQLFSPVGTKRYSDNGQRDKLPYTLEPVIGSANYGGHNNDTYGAFYNFYVSPTAKDLDPYFFVGKVDFGAVVMDNFQWFQDNNIHLANNDNQIPKNVKEVRGYGLRGPLLLSGWGYDVAGYPVPGDGAGFFRPNPGENRADWKTGPVDLKWDDERQVWSGGPQFVEGILTKAIKPAKSTKPDDANPKGNVTITPDLNGVMAIRRRTATAWDNFGEPTKWKWHQTNELVGITNRDPTLSVDPEEAEYGIYVMATRINQEWRVVYISCDNLDVEA